MKTKIALAEQREKLQGRLRKYHVLDFIKDMIFINLGMAIYDVGWALFLLPYKITTGGGAGLCAIVQYATGIPMQYSLLAVNALLLLLAWWQLGPKFTLKTLYAVLSLTFYLEVGQDIVSNLVCIVVEEGYCGDSVFVKEILMLSHGRPPKIVVTLADQLFAGQGIQKTEILERILKLKSPGNIARNDHRVLLVDHRTPVLADLFHIIDPAGAKDGHGFASVRGKMQIGHDVK